MCSPHLQTATALPWKCKTVLFKLCSTTISGKQRHFHSINHVKTVNHVTLQWVFKVTSFARVATASAFHWCMRWKKCTTDELIEQWHIQTPWSNLCSLNTGCKVRSSMTLFTVLGRLMLWESLEVFEKSAVWSKLLPSIVQKSIYGLHKVVQQQYIGEAVGL